jgi:hypothetical protein
MKPAVPDDFWICARRLHVSTLPASHCAQCGTEMEEATVDAPRRGHYADMEWARDCLLDTGLCNGPEDKPKAAMALSNIIDTFGPAGRAA